MLRPNEMVVQATPINVMYNGFEDINKPIYDVFTIRSDII